MPRLDLDQYLAEQHKDPFVVVFAGKEYTAPAEIPWTALQKAQEIDGKEVGQEQIGEIIGLFLGKEAWDQMVADGIGFKAALQLMNGLMEQMMADLPGEGDPKAVMAEMQKRMEANGFASASKTAPATSAAS